MEEIEVFKKLIQTFRSRIIDLRTLIPLDKGMIWKSVKNNGKVIIMGDEDVYWRLLIRKLFYDIMRNVFYEVFLSVNARFFQFQFFCV